MCDQPAHTILHRMERKIDKIDEDLTSMSENQVALMDEVYGYRNKKGLSAKVDEINSGNKRESIVVSTITAVIVAVASVFGIRTGGL